MTLMYVRSKEIKTLNHRIDKKRVRGQTYFREARKHRELVHKLRKLESEASLARTLTYAFF